MRAVDRKPISGDPTLKSRISRRRAEVDIFRGLQVVR